ncbi:hypothetical protein J2S43_005400 [Catenuloplanes nepalensis]|uniref:Immunity protein 35 domain-containing protein n=1 Tax=Catenuloplanes nepalensis TaxID=587533 RepID=A0ABT9MZL9_9ACTN|nr:YrhB domain-containing protein [Catenuloplanes nepalensis]MDP9796888.1 hypothetical protein [Catenuloplanes nepalensis]
MDLDQARTRALAKLGEIEDTATPLALDPSAAPVEVEWAWLFSFNSARYLETRSFGDLVPSGPVVVNKDGSDVWVANSAPPVEQWLNRYAEQHGYPTVPLPSSSPF